MTTITHSAPIVSILAAIRRTFAQSGHARKALAGVGLMATILAPVTLVRAGLGEIAAGRSLSVFAPSAIGFLHFDNTFDGDGRRTDAFGLSSDSVASTALLPDGKIVAAVNIRTGNGGTTKGEGLIVRFNPDGTRDLTFAGGCRETAILGLASAGVGGLALQPDGKAVFIGSRTNFVNPGGTGTTTSQSVQRCNADGTSDSSFNPLGLNFGNQGGIGSVAVRPDGKVLVAGRFQSGFTGTPQLGVYRFHPDGSPDTTWAGDGSAFTSVLSGAGPMAVQSDGKVYVAAASSSAVMRINDSGAADPTFDGDGLIPTPFQVRSLVVQPDGKLLVAGSRSNGSNLDFSVARYNTDGSVDTTFGNNGIATTPIGPGDDTVQSIALQADGKFVVAGAANNGTDADFALVRYNTDGSLDTTFDGDGKLTTPLHSGADGASSVLVRGDGKLTALGFTDSGASDDIGLVQYLPDGSLDTAFGTGGKSVIDLENQSSGASSAAVQADGKVVVAGSAINGDLNSDFAVIRYNADGSLDTTFDGDGKAVTGVLSWNDSAASIAVQPDGKIVAAGRAQATANGSSYSFAVARYNSDGSLDASFDGDGKVATEVASSNYGASSVAIQADGKIVVAGDAHGSSNQDFAVVRYNPDGSLDTSFDGDGKAITPVTTGADRAWSVKIQPDEKIVAVGEGNGDFALVRYNTDGSLDSSFDGDGKVLSNLGSSDGAYSAQLQTDGKIVAAGESGDNFGLARYNPDGSLDASFGSGGTVITDMPGSDGASSVAIQTDGKILTAGNDSGGGGEAAFLFARYRTNGSLDTTFDLDGKASVTGLGSLAAMTLDAQNKILAVGSNGSPFAAGAFTIARLFNKTSVLFDHEGNGAADLAVWRPSNGVSTWYTQNSLGFSVRGWGQAGDKLAPADYDGDGNSDLAVFRPSDGSWRIRYSGTQTVVIFNFGQDGDLPVPADRNADGIAEPVLFRPSTSTWHTMFGPGISTIVQFGVAGDKPLLGDFDADGRADNAVYRPSNHVWYIQGSATGFRAMTWGEDGDITVPADYDGDGATDIAVWRPSLGRWYIIGSSAGWMIRTWGEPGDIPTPADYDGDGRADVSIFRPSSGTWYTVFSTTGSFWVRQFGQNGDVPIASAYIP